MARTLYTHAGCASAAAFLANVNDDLVAEGWTIDKYVSGENGELYFHNAAGLYFSMAAKSSIRTVEEPGWRHICICGNTGFNTALGWYEQPGCFTPTMTIPDVGYGPSEGHFAYDQSYYGKLVGWWFSPAVDQYVVCGPDDIFIYSVGSGYSSLGGELAGVDELCLNMYLGAVEMFSPSFPDSSSGQYLVSDVLCGYCNINSRLSEILTGGLFGRYGFNYLNNLTKSYESLGFVENSGFLWRGADHWYDLRLSHHWLPWWSFSAANTSSPSVYYPLLRTPLEDRCLFFEKQLGWNATVDRASLWPVITSLKEMDGVEACNYPMGKMPYFAVELPHPVQPGEALSVGSKEFVCFPHLFTDSTFGAAIRIS